MKLMRLALAGSILCIEATLVASSALLHMPSLARRDDLHQRMAAASKFYEGELERRSPQSSTNAGDISLTAPDVERNASTEAACLKGMSSLTNVTNEPGFAACYNVLDWHENMGGMFQADLRFFQFSTASGRFANVSASDIMVSLNFPNSTQFSILGNTKRSIPSLTKRQSAPTQIQQFSLVGNFRMQLDLDKINSTEVMSLLIPQISLQASVDGNTIVSQINSSDIVYFVAGEFQDEATPQIAAQAANPAMAQAAIEASRGFVLPGTEFGIFPTGLIVTGAWCILFLVAFGLGTMGRMRHRDIYRKRVAATSGRNGKR